MRKMSVLRTAPASVDLATHIEAAVRTPAGTPKHAARAAETVYTQSPWRICAVDTLLIA